MPMFPPDALVAVWPSNIHTDLETLTALGDQLSELSQAFSRTGNTAVASELNQAVITLRYRIAKIRQHVANKVDGDFRAAEQASANILDAALAGAKSAYLDERRRELGSDKNG